MPSRQPTPSVTLQSGVAPAGVISRAELGAVGPARALRVGWGVTFALALCLYALTLAPGVVWGDSACLAVDVTTAQRPIGGAGDHPLFLLLGQAMRPFPGDLAWKLNLLTVSCGALALAFVYA